MCEFEYNRLIFNSKFNFEPILEMFIIYIKEIMKKLFYQLLLQMNVTFIH